MQNSNLIQNSSGNVFADIGMSNPSETLQKAELTRQIFETLDIKNITSDQTCKILDIDSEQLSDLRIGRLRRFSISELIGFMSCLSN